MDIFEKIKLLPLHKQKEIEAIVDAAIVAAETEKLNIPELIEKRRKNLDKYKGRIWMADDFNDTPEEFKAYL
ncbi:MAG: hypothetical protein EOP43_06890 [Sphingobacteriaceae bacterium]|nr:MAG: hypothetical protein EOP43_06890 [Sphingobacteriaceae bacterium]